MSGLPNSRPILVDFASLLTKKLSLLICGNIIKGFSTQKHRNYLNRRAIEWFQKHKVKSFYVQVDEEDFESGSRALMQVSVVYVCDKNKKK